MYCLFCAQVILETKKFLCFISSPNIIVGVLNITKCLVKRQLIHPRFYYHVYTSQWEIFLNFRKDFDCKLSFFISILFYLHHSEHHHLKIAPTTEVSPFTPSASQLRTLRSFNKMEKNPNPPSKYPPVMEIIFLKCLWQCTNVLT